MSKKKSKHSHYPSEGNKKRYQREKPKGFRSENAADGKRRYYAVTYHKLHKILVYKHAARENVPELFNKIIGKYAHI